MSRYISTVYFDREHMPYSEDEPFRCLRCGRLMLMVNREVMSVVVSDVLPPQAFMTPGAAVITQKCRGCPQMYKMYFQ